VMTAPLSASRTLTSAVVLGGGVELAGSVSLAQVATGTGPVPASCMPKVVVAPGASAPFHGALFAVTVPAELLTVVPHALMIRWLAGRVHVTVHLVAAVVEVFATVKETISPPEVPLPQAASILAVAVQAPVRVVAADALSMTSGASTNADTTPRPAASPHTAVVTRLDTAMMEASLVRW